MSHPTPPSDLPSPPFINITGIANFRDIGGYPCSSSSSAADVTAPLSIRRNLVFRAADPSRVQPDGLAKLHQLRVAKVFDLRSKPEIERRGPEWAGVAVDAGAFVTRGDGDGNGEVDAGAIERVWCPVFAAADYGPEQVALRYKEYASSGSEGFVRAYTDILTNGAAAYRTVLAHLAQLDPQPCVVHCTAGKDRTGVLVALLYLLCGVPRRVIADEYALTDLGLEHLKPLFIERLSSNPALAGNEEGVRNMISSRAENMRATVEMIGERFGGAEEYVRRVVGLSGEEVERLRANLVVDEAPVLPSM